MRKLAQPDARAAKSGYFPQLPIESGVSPHGFALGTRALGVALPLDSTQCGWARRGVPYYRRQWFPIATSSDTYRASGPRCDPSRNRLRERRLHLYPISARRAPRPTGGCGASAIQRGLYFPRPCDVNGEFRNTSDTGRSRARVCMRLASCAGATSARISVGPGDVVSDRCHPIKQRRTITRAKKPHRGRGAVTGARLQ